MSRYAGPSSKDRCDRCSAAAKLKVLLGRERELYFCGHHANKYAADLAKIAVEFIPSPDFSWKDPVLAGARR
jgi:hypothetical protein